MGEAFTNWGLGMNEKTAVEVGLVVAGSFAYLILMSMTGLDEPMGVGDEQA